MGQNNLPLDSGFAEALAARPGKWSLLVGGNKYECELLRRRDKGGGSGAAKHEIRAGDWRALVRGEGVAEGDVVRFELAPQRGRALRVTITRPRDKRKRLAAQVAATEGDEDGAGPSRPDKRSSAPAKRKRQQQQQAAPKKGKKAGGSGKGMAQGAAAAGVAAEQNAPSAVAAGEAGGTTEAKKAGKSSQQEAKKQQQRPPPQEGREEQQEGEEESEERRRMKRVRRPKLKQRSSTGPASQQPAQDDAPAAPSPAPADAARQQTEQRGSVQQRQQLSPTPVVAAAPLEMSAPPSNERAGPSAADVAEMPPSHQQQQQAEAECLAAYAERIAQHGPARAARAWLSTALGDARSYEAHCVALRSQLAAVQEAVERNLRNTVELGHNNSLLVRGDHGSGKSLVVERALSTVCARYNAGRTAADPRVGVVRLVGWAHGDDRVAFREIARQLCVTFNCTFSRVSAVEENMQFLRGMLELLAREGKVVAFLLDEFDGFARRAKQTVLYNLLDALQASGMQACVVGLTHRHDVVELLEKRVKSRFSHRMLHVPVPPGVARRPARPPREEGGAGEEAQDGMLDVLQAMLTLPPAFPDQAYAAQHNRAVAQACADAGVRQAMQVALPLRPGVCHTMEVAAAVLDAAAAAGKLPSAGDLAGALKRLAAQQADAAVAGVGQLSVLEMILLVAAGRLRDKLRRGGLATSDAINFEMVHAEFGLYSGQGSHVDHYSKAAAAKGFDHLLSLGLLQYADPRNEVRPGARQYAAVHLQLTRAELEAGLERHESCPAQLPHWLRKEALGTTAGAFLAA
eukprot:scaffold10.g2462.t1